MIDARERLNNIIEAELKGAMPRGKVPSTKKNILLLQEKMLRAMYKALNKGIDEGLIDPTFEGKQLNGDQNE